MKSLIAFTKKEWMEQLRSGRLLLLLILFTLFGIMNPALAKLTPWLFELMADSLEESGMVVTTVTVDALTSWTQFFKNIPMALIVFVLTESSIFTKEYQSGTLVLALTKGLERYKVVLAKTTVLAVLWSAGYWLCYGVTFVYNDYFWDNGTTKNLLFSTTCWWLFGLFVVTLMVLFSVLSEANTGVLLSTGGVILATYLISLLPKAKPFSPAKLMGSVALLAGVEEKDAYYKAILITVMLCVAGVGASIPVQNKRKM